MITGPLFATETIALTEPEQQQLSVLEDTIHRGLETFVQVGSAFAVIRDGRLYRATHRTFEDYCRDRWEMARQQANRLIAAAEAVRNLEPIGSILPTSESQVRPIAHLEPDDQREVWQQAVDTAPNGKVTAAHVQNVVDEYREKAYPLTASNHAVSLDPDYDGDEWYTPVEYIEAARTVLGEIDLDPASCEAANETVQAARFFSKEDDALTQAWHGRIWLNPPYSRPLINHFVAKLISEYETGNVTEAVILTNNSSDTGWFHDLLSRYPACFTRGRVQFWRPDADVFGARQGQTLFYLGDDFEAFRFAFSGFGQVVIKA